MKKLAELLATGLVSMVFVGGCLAEEARKPETLVIESKPGIESKLIQDAYKKIAEKFEKQGKYIEAREIYLELGDMENAHRVYLEFLRHK